MQNSMTGIPAAVIQTPQQSKLFTQVYNGVAQTIRTFSPDFPRGLYTKLILRLSGTLNKTESVAGTLAAESPLTLLRAIRILGDGDLIKEIDGPHARVLFHHIKRGVDTDFTNVSLGTDAGEVFSARLEIDFQSLGTAFPNASWWDASRYNQITFEVDWGARTPDMIAAGTYTGESFGTTILDVYGEMVLSPVARQATYLISKHTQKVVAISSIAQAGYLIQLPVGEIIRGILLSQYTLAPKIPIATLVIAGANVVIRVTGPAGQYRKVETTWGELQQRNKGKYGIAMPTGYAFIDFAESGDIAQCLRADGGNVTAVELLIDVASVASAFFQVEMETFKPGLLAGRN